MQGIKISIGWMFYSFALIMFLACFLVLLSPEYAAYKYTEGNNIQSWWWISTVADVVHFIFFIVILSFLGVAGKLLSWNIEGNMNDDTTRAWTFWLLPNILLWPLLLVGLHVVIYS